MAKYNKIRNLKVFKTKIWSFYRVILQKMGRRNSSQMILYLYATWKIPERILYWQTKLNEFFQTYLPARSNVPHFSTKRNLRSKRKWQTFEGKIFHDVKKIEIYFPHNTFASCIFFIRNFLFKNIVRKN